MSTEPFIGEIKMLAFDWAPKGYLTCSGQILSIQTNTALFSLLGTLYGGNGIQTFGLPDLRGRMPISQGTGPGLPTHTMGEISGTPNVSLLTSNMPSHNHTLNSARGAIAVNTANGDTGSPAGAFLASSTANIYAEGPESGKSLGGLSLTGSTDISGTGAPFNVMNPYLVINYSIAINGIFPSRP